MILEVSTGRSLFSKMMTGREVPTSVKHKKYLNGDIVIYLGTTFNHNLVNQSPSRGFIYPLHYQKVGSEHKFTQCGQLLCQGAVIDMDFLAYDPGATYLIAGVNSFV